MERKPTLNVLKVAAKMDIVNKLQIIHKGEKSEVGTLHMWKSSVFVQQGLEMSP